MQASSLSEIKKELNRLSPDEVLELCMRVVKFKKENKELLSYLLFEAQDEQAYIHNRKENIDEQFSEINMHNLRITKKNLRKILRNTNKYIRYSGNKQTLAELLIYFCKKMKSSGIAIHKSPALQNILEAQTKKIHAALKTMDEDLQYDYKKELI
ncbi:MAG: hypothetical protein H7Y00_15900 [Fimbriimonadaceae bacterium]|nr:hypothetical protein [Chitinophagales bacterium]